MSFRTSLTVLAAPLALAICCEPGAVAVWGQEQPTASPDQQVLEFDTAEIEGTIRLDGAYHGVTRLVDKRSGRQVIDPRYSALNLFKLMSVNLMMGQPRQMERTVRIGPDWAEIRWPKTDMHRGEVVARYEVRPHGAVDLIVTVRSEGTYPAYETFLSSYFDKTLQPHVYLKTRDGKSSDLVLPMANDVFRGTVLVFPRDMPSARHCLDGRWDRSEGGVPVVQMCPVRCYAHCLAMLVDADNTLAVLLMAEQDIDVVGHAANGREAIDMAESLRPDVIVMDMAMPVMSGDQAASCIKQHMPHVRIVALSMFEEASMADRMLSAGADAYLLKTSPAGDLLSAIRGGRCRPNRLTES